MKILLVDDEARHLRGMIQMIRDIRPEYEIFSAKNGLEALHLVRESRPDLVLTDIRMPEMDGLAFLGEMKKLEGTQPNVVFLSAYNLFEYAQSALRNGAYDYLLKPVDPDKVEAVLDRVEQQVQEQSSEELDSLLHAWLSTSTQRDVPLPKRMTERLRGQGWIAVTEWAVPTSSQTVSSKLQALWSSYGTVYTYKVEPATGGDHEQWVSIIAGADKVLPQSSQLRQAIEAFQLEVVTARHGIGVLCDDLLTSGPYAYITATNALAYTFYERFGGLVCYDELKPQAEVQQEPDTELLFHALHHQDRERARQLCSEAIDLLANEGATPPALLKEHASLMVMKLKSRCREVLDREQSNTLTNMAIADIPACETYLAIQQLLVSCIDLLLEALRTTKRGRSEFVIDACLRLIQEKYMEELNLETVAEHYFFNASYFSTLFKQQTGRTFSEALTSTRLQRAQELLREEGASLKIYQIAELCGYRDHKYFCRTFKKHTGLTPDAYRHATLTRAREGGAK